MHTWRAAEIWPQLTNHPIKLYLVKMNIYIFRNLVLTAVPKVKYPPSPLTYSYLQGRAGSATHYGARTWPGQG